MAYNPMKLDQYTVGQSFNNYNDFDFVDVTPMNCADFNIGYRFNKYHEALNSQASFYGKPVKGVAFNVQDGKIHDVLLRLNVSDILIFYQDLESIYGKAEMFRLSNTFIEGRGFKTPEKYPKDTVELEYRKMPQPRIEDYENLNSISWNDLETSLDKVKDREVSLFVYNVSKSSIDGAVVYEVQLNFRVMQF